MENKTETRPCCETTSDGYLCPLKAAEGKEQCWVHAYRPLHWTTAPAEYDYPLCVERTGRKGKWRDCTVEEIRVLDQYRFENFQVPRYGSGLYCVLARNTTVHVEGEATS